MGAYGSTGCMCVVCDKRSDEHARWFLVIENSWLDRIKVLSWHPVLAEQSAMHSVCGKRHLEMLLTHWLTYGNFNSQSARIPEVTLADHVAVPGNELTLPLPGQLVGELAVHRESLSRLWTGSPEARESIFEALTGGLGVSQTAHLEASAEPAEPPQPGAVVAHPGEYLEFALQ
jgi:hypothetical protein